MHNKLVSGGGDDFRHNMSKDCFPLIYTQINSLLRVISGILNSIMHLEKLNIFKLT